MKKILLISILILTIFLVNAGCVKEVHKEQPGDNEANLLKQKIAELEQSLEQKEQELKKYQPKQVSYMMDLTKWSEDEIMQAFKKENENFKADGSWFEYKYDPEEDYYYDIEGPIFQDPFTKLAYKQQAREWNTNRLRIFDLGYDDINLAESRYNTYKEEIIEVQTRLDEELSCFEQLSCRDVKLIQCKKGKEEYYSWFAERYLFVKRNDKGDTFKTFTKIYCEPISGFFGITSNVVLAAEKQTASIINFLRKLI